MSNNSLGFVHRFAPSPNGSSLTLLALHGTGGDENDLLPISRKLDASASILSPRGNVFENGMPRFFRRISEGVFDLKDLEFRTSELADFVSSSMREYRLNIDRVVAVGYSNGANIAANILFQRPKVFAGAILLRPMLPMEPRLLPDLSSKPVFISEGISDNIVPKHSTARLVELLKESGAHVNVASQVAGHGLVPRDIKDAKEWLKRTLY